MNKKEINKLFKEIDELIIKSWSPYPVEIRDSIFIKKLKALKEKWLKNTKEE
jgi:hypothetical protein